MNSIDPDKSLMKDALKKYNRDSKEAIVKIATTGTLHTTCGQPLAPPPVD